MSSLSGDSWQQVLDLAAEQHGYFTRAQAHKRGLSDVDLGRAARKERLRRIAHGVYAIQGASELRWEDIWVAWLRLDPELPAYERSRKPHSLAARATAAWIYEIGDLTPHPIEFCVDKSRRSLPDIRYRRATWGDDDWELVEGLPVTRPHRIVADLLGSGVDVDHITDIAVDAIGRGLLRIEELETALDPLLKQGPAATVLESVTTQTSTTQRSFHVTVLEEDGRPIEGASILASAPNNTYKTAITDAKGEASLDIVRGRPYVLYCAYPNRSSVIREVSPRETSVTATMRSDNTGSVIFPEGTGHLPGLSGRLSPILDTSGRTYLYASNVAIESGKAQPVQFNFQEWISLEDADGITASVRINQIRGKAVVLDYRVGKR